MRFKIYRDSAGEFRWRLVAKNQRTIADSGEGYHNLRDCAAAITKVKRTNAATPVETVGVGS